MATFESEYGIGDEVIYRGEKYIVMWVTFSPMTITYRIENESSVFTGLEESILKSTEIEGE